ncbi:hypothetical protein GCM10029992_23540 [Glycomyces albus]
MAALADELGTARGEARLLAERTAAAAQTAGGRAEATITAAARKRTKLTAIHERMLATLRARRDQTLASGIRAAREASAEAAPAAAGATWDEWEPVAALGRGPAPLLRVGELDDEAALPALVGLLDRDHLALDASAAAALPGLLLRAVGSAPAGLVRLHIYDPERLGGALSAFAPLGKAGLLSFIGPSGLRETLDDLVEHVRRVNAEVLAGEHETLAGLASATGRRPEPWRVLVLVDSGIDRWHDHDRAQLARLRRTGVAAGVHLVTVGDSDEDAAADRHRLPRPRRRRPPRRTAADTDDHRGRQGRRREARRRTRAGPTGRPPAAAAVGRPVGHRTPGRARREPSGEPAIVALGDNPPHALVGGPSGSGKTNLLYAWIASLASSYSPDELEFHLLDFKEGVSFARFASGRRDPTWLPHVRLVGVNINDDREFGLALLRHLKTELRRRAEAAKAHEATKLEELRAADPEGHWPRIVAVIDEFQVLLETRDAVTDEAVGLLEDLARRGRSQGIHLILASQDVAGIEALWGRPSLVAQFTLRIALPKARRVLAENNHAADTVPRFCAIVNDESGVSGANRTVAVPNAGHAEAWEPLQRRLWQARPEGNEPPALFDGDHVPALTGRTPAPETAILGQTIDVAAAGAEFGLHRAPGRNLAVLGTRGTEAADVLASAALTAARAQRLAVDICCLEPDAATGALGLASALEAEGASVDWHDNLADACKDWEDRADGTLRLNLVYAVDAGSARLDAAQAAGLRAMLLDGPERHLHTLGWWRSVPRLREDLGGFSARFDAVDAWLALDVQGPELAPLSPASSGPAWYPGSAGACTSTGPGTAARRSSSPTRPTPRSPAPTPSSTARSTEGDPRMTRYHEAVAAYLTDRAAAEAEIEAVDEAYRAETAALTESVAAARAERDEANGAAVEGATLVAETDKTVAVLWRALGGFVGHRRTGPTPAAAGPLDRSRAAPDADRVRARLRRADRLLTLARQGELPMEAPRHTEIGAAAIGAACAAAAVAAAAWILSGSAEGEAASGGQALAALVLFLGIPAGPVVLGVWQSWQYRVRPRPGHLLACLIAGVVVSCSLAAVFLRGM